MKQLEFSQLHRTFIRKCLTTQLLSYTDQINNKISAPPIPSPQGVYTETWTAEFLHLPRIYYSLVSHNFTNLASLTPASWASLVGRQGTHTHQAIVIQGTRTQSSC